MSSYHVINAIWIGVFPMLAVTVLIGIICYIICCLNHIKIKFKEYRKRKAIKRTRLKMLKETRKKLSIKKNDINKLENDSNYQDQDQDQHYDIHERLFSSSEVIFTPINKPILDYQSPDRSRLSLDLKPVYTPTINQEPSKTQVYKPYATGSAGDLFTTIPDTPIEQLIVQELNESPKSLFSRYKILTKISNENRSNSTISNKNIKKSVSNEDMTKQKNDEKKENNNLKLDTNLSDVETKTKSLTESNLSTSINNNHNYDSDDDDTQNDYDDSSSQSDQLSSKKTDQSLETNKNTSINICNNKSSKIKKIEFSSNRLSSDIDNEDDLVSNYDDDSLSSGINLPSNKKISNSNLNFKNLNNTIETICESKPINEIRKKSILSGSSSTITSSHTVIHKINNNNNNNLNQVENNQNNNNNDNNLIKKELLSVNSTGSKSILANSTSLSDIDPDDNILKDLLVKTSNVISKKS